MSCIRLGEVPVRNGTATFGSMHGLRRLDPEKIRAHDVSFGSSGDQPRGPSTGHGPGIRRTFHGGATIFRRAEAPDMDRAGDLAFSLMQGERFLMTLERRFP